MFVTWQRADIIIYLFIQRYKVPDQCSLSPESEGSPDPSPPILPLWRLLRLGLLRREEGSES